MYSRQFVGRMRICTNDGHRLSEAMELAANQVKELTERAQGEQDRREEARAWKERQDNQRALNKLGDALFGEDDKPPIPPPEPPARFVVEVTFIYDDADRVLEVKASTGAVIEHRYEGARDHQRPSERRCARRQR